MAEKKRNGKIITFYSYKGGTGRSMILANVAWILASQGRQVLALDWDLEAPGLHRYFYPFLPDKSLTSSEGVIDFVHKFTAAATIPEPSKEQEGAMPAGGPSGAGEEGGDQWYKPYSNILRYAASLKWDFNKGGTLDFIPAGRQGPSYPTRINSFNWDHFYNQLGGGRLLELAKERMRAEYDYILIDSRTGVSDTAGICTIQMPDILVVCFTLNNQSIEGASDVAQDVFQKRQNAARARAGANPDTEPKPEDAIQIFPVPMRLENAEKAKLEARMNYAREKFQRFPNSLPAESRERYWGYVPVTYVPFYAYEEILAVFGDRPAQRVTVLVAAEQLCSYLTAGTIEKLDPPSESERQQVLRDFEGGLSAGVPNDGADREMREEWETLKINSEELAKRLRRTYVSSVIFLLLFLIFGGFLVYRLSSRNERPNKSIQLAAYATAAEDPELKVLLALEAVRAEQTTQAVGALRSSLQEMRQTAVLRGYKDQIFNAVFSSDGKLILAASADGIGMLWEQNGGVWQVKRLFESPASDVRFAVFSPDNQFVATTGYETTARVFVTDSGLEVASMEPEARRTLVGFVAAPKVRSVAFSPDGRNLVIGTAGDADIWDWRAAKAWMSVGQHTEDINGAVYSPDGRYIVTASSDRTAAIWDAVSGKLISRLTLHTGEVYTARFSLDSRFVVTASQDSTARVWDTTGKSVTVLTGHDGAVRGATFSPDGRSVVTASVDGTARVWNVETGQTTLILRGHRTTVFSAEFSPDGKYVLTGSGDKTLRVWDVSEVLSFGGSVGEMTSQACNRLSRNMTQEEWQRYMAGETYRKTCDNLP